MFAWKRPRRLAVGIVGCGAIGGALARYIERELSGEMTVAALTDLDQRKAQQLAAQLAGRPRVLPLTSAIQQAALIIEAASANVSFHIAQQALEAGRHCLVMSVGGLLGRTEALGALARERGVQLLVPSGALAGMDAVKAFRGRIRRATLTSRKPPQALQAAPFVQERRLSLETLQQESVIFEGSAQEAVIGFPQNANVAATLALSTGAPDVVRVRIIAVPRAAVNSHEVSVEGDWGAMTARLESVPSAENPKTSQAAIASAQALLRDLTESVRLGT